MAFFSQQIEFCNPFPIVFLCGVSINRGKPQADKRHVLKEYLKTQGCCPIILEDYLRLGVGKGTKPGYADIDIKNLNDAELAVALVADLVIILHESHSTAAEWSLFASNEHIRDRVCVLYPDSRIVEDNHFTGYLKHALEDLTRDVEVFSPVVKRQYKFDRQYNIFTFYPNNEIDLDTKNKLKGFICDNNSIQCYNLVKSRYRAGTKSGYASYWLDKDGHRILFACEAQYLKCEFISLFSVDEFRSSLKVTNDFNEFRDRCTRYLVETLKNTIQRIETIDIADYKLEFIIQGINPRLSLKHIVSVMLYVFHTLEWIKLDGKSHVALTKQKNERAGFSYYFGRYKCLVTQEIQDSSWRTNK